MTDLVMPHMHGFQLIEQLRASGYQDVIIALSASVFETDEQQSHRIAMHLAQLELPSEMLSRLPEHLVTWPSPIHT